MAFACSGVTLTTLYQTAGSGSGAPSMVAGVLNPFLAIESSSPGPPIDAGIGLGSSADASYVPHGLRSLGFCSIVSAAKLLLADVVTAAIRPAITRVARRRLVVALLMFPPRL